MLYKRKGLPEEDEIVLCKVTKIFPNSVFVELLEFGEAGMVHISEISPGRIRNLRDFVSEGRQIVCKVLRIDREKGHIDLSLRRVNSTQRMQKLNEYKQELKAESLVQNLAKKLDKPAEELYKKITEKVFTEFSSLYFCFREVASGNADLEKLGLEKKLAKELAAAILDKFKPPKVFIKGEIKIQTFAPDGVEKIKSTLTEIETVSPTLSLFYLGAGRFKLLIEDNEYKSAESTLKKVQDVLEKFNDKQSTAVYEREKE